MPPLSRRRFVELSSITGLGLLLAPVACSRAANPAVPESFAALFANPPRSYQPKFRWWWPHGLVDTAQIRREIDAMADAGFGGAEIADVHHSVHQDLSADTHGWGTEPWRAAVKAALEQAKKREMSIDHSIGPSWPAASPLVTPDSEAACKELAVGKRIVEPGEAFSGPVPPPDNRPHAGVSEQKLVALQALRLAPGADLQAKELELEAASLVDLYPLVSDGRLVWTAPDTGKWILVSYWLRGSAQRPEGGPHTRPISYVVDHFSSAGTQAIIDLWEQKALTPEIRSLIAEVGGCLFEDSIEMETHETIWTPKLMDEFEKRRGYSLLLYLPLVVQRKEDPIFQYADFDARHIYHDWWQTLSELFLENHFEALRAWAQSLGLGFRGQPYGLRTDAIRAAATLDIAEGESLGFKNLDDYRSLAGGRDMGGRTILSNEAGAFPGAAYSLTWKRVLQTLNPQFAAGVNQTVLHGFAYAEAPGAKWPGFAAFTPYGGRAGYSEAWGPRQPSWKHVPSIAGYFSRVHFLLQQGQPQVDIAFLRQKGYAGSGFGAPWFSQEGVFEGWTHEFISPATLELPSAVAREKRLAPDGPSFKALVFEGDAFHGKKSTFDLATAQRVLRLAQDGLPILVIGDWSEPLPSGIRNTHTEEELAKLFQAILLQPSVVNARERTDIPQGLKQLNLQPRIAHPKSPLLHAERKTKDARIFYFCNASDEESLSTEITISVSDNRRHSYRLDLWTGSIYRIQSISADPRTVTLPVSLGPKESGAFILTSETLAAERIAALETTHLKRRLPLGPWNLEVQSWSPGEEISQTRKVSKSLTLESLTPWNEIESLSDDSGLGSYRCQFEVDEELFAAERAVLRWDRAFDTLRIVLNGKQLPPCDPLRNEAKLHGYLKRGRNELVIESSTTLNNRLRVSDPDVYGANKRQEYGLSGEVAIHY